jgi:catechol 2,3-dioxygenase-like lactoylglutathione lyase family enzyme
MRIKRIKESCLYVADLQRTKAFYTGLLGAELIGIAPKRHVFMRVGDAVLLCFLARVTSKDKLKHGARGPQHLAFEVPKSEYAAWKRRVRARRIRLLKEVHWRKGVRSFYFLDPDKHLLEIVEPGLWGK